MSDHYALFSGGHDSLVSTHKILGERPEATVLHIDTGIGIPETREYVERVCDRFGWPLTVETTEFSYDDAVKEHGFPGPGVHRKWIWHAPIHDFTQADVDAYIDTHDLPRSPVKRRYHHSGECLCGAFGNRDEELVLLEAHFPGAADRIKRLERAVQAIHGTDDATSFWAHGRMTPTAKRGLLADHDDSQMVLCASCEGGMR